MTDNARGMRTTWCYVIFPILLSIVLSVTAGFVSAAIKRSPHWFAVRTVCLMRMHLHLRPEQASALRGLIEDYKGKLNALQSQERDVWATSFVDGLQDHSKEIDAITHHINELRLDVLRNMVQVLAPDQRDAFLKELSRLESDRAGRS